MRQSRSARAVISGRNTPFPRSRWNVTAKVRPLCWRIPSSPAGSRAVGLEVVPTDDGERAVWRKFIMLVALSGVTSLMRRPIGAVLAHPDARDFFRQLITEAIAVADSEGHVFAPDVVDEIVGLVGKQPYEQKSSMLVDLESGKPLELPWLSGRVHALGRTHGILTPANTAVWVSLCTHVDGAPGADGG